MTEQHEDLNELKKPTECACLLDWISKGGAR